MDPAQGERAPTRYGRQPGSPGGCRCRAGIGDLCGAARPVTWPTGFPEGEADDLFEAECSAAGVGLLELLVAEGRTCLVEAFLPAARVERIPPGSDLVHQGVLGAVQDGCPVPVTQVGGQGREPEDGGGQGVLVAGAAAPPDDVLESGSRAVEVMLGPQYLGPGCPAR